MTSVVLVGSGADALKVKDWDLSPYVVGAINNAWSVPSKLTAHIRSGDWIPAPGNRPPPDLYQTVRFVSFHEYDGPDQRNRYGRQHLGIGATMLWNAAYWMLATYQPRHLYFVGCSMNYPEGRANTFYRGGKADPLRFPRKTLDRWYRLFEERANQEGCTVYNAGDPGIIPYRQVGYPSPATTTPMTLD